MTTTTVQDRLIRQVRRSADDRAEMLRCIAEHWDATIFTYDRLGDPTYTADVIVNGLTAAAAEYAAPDMPRVLIRSCMEELRDRVHDLREYETGGFWDGDPDWSDDMILARLNMDIDDALFPLLHGLDVTNACSTCRKHLPHPSAWKIREAGSLFCEDHR